MSTPSFILENSLLKNLSERFWKSSANVIGLLYVDQALPGNSRLSSVACGEAPASILTLWQSQ
ncbi:unknown [Bacteroides sp. CAG:545]|nr:unknown [Bacteroides sp. CAG:545]